MVGTHIKEWQLVLLIRFQTKGRGYCTNRENIVTSTVCLYLTKTYHFILFQEPLNPVNLGRRMQRSLVRTLISTITIISSGFIPSFLDYLRGLPERNLQQQQRMQLSARGRRISNKENVILEFDGEPRVTGTFLPCSWEWLGGGKQMKSWWSDKIVVFPPVLINSYSVAKTTL